jgi:plasmid stabilization system protein ParE
MRVVFRKRAEADLGEIVEWYGTVAPDAIPRILDDIYRAIDLLIDFPRAGMPVPDTPFRRIVTRRYHFKIAYELGRNEVFIVGVFRFQDRQA